jgi:oxygen-independent coproporphyrinogen-3 oxidase
MNRESLSLYIHIPFCSLKCAYCDFNSYAGLDELVEPYCDALIEEMRLWGAVVKGRPVPTVFFGGGTPSLLPLAQVERIMEALRESFAMEEGAEVSLEANPGTVDLDYLRGLGAAGMNRISFGVQSFHDDELAALDRIHSAEEAVQCYRWAREAGFERINLDFMYGLSEPFDSPSAALRAAQGRQPMERWQQTLERAIELAPDHMSLYALTVEDGTKLAYDIDHGRVPEPDSDMQAAMYEWSCERMAAAGYEQYEISNWCRPGQECRHNLVYWRNGEWLGLGPGAHSHWGGIEPSANSRQPSALSRQPSAISRQPGYRFADVYSPRRYIELVGETAAKGVDAGAAPRDVLRQMRQVTYVEEQAPEAAMADAAILGLRLNEGLDVQEFEQRYGTGLEATYGPALDEMTDAGLLERVNGAVRLTARGRLLANEVFVRLLPD